MPDTKYDNKGQKPTTAESKGTPDTPKAVEKTPESTKPATLDERLAQMDSKPAPQGFSAPPADVKKVSDNTEAKPKVEAKPVEVKKPEPVVTKTAPVAAPEQKSFEKLAEDKKSASAPEPKVETKTEPVERVMEEVEPEGKNRVVRMFVVGVIVGALLTSIFI